MTRYGAFFLCEECGYAIIIPSGVPSKCDACGKYFCFRRCTGEEYHNAETNDGKLKEEVEK